MQLLLWLLNLFRPVFFLRGVRSAYRLAGGDSCPPHTFGWSLGRVNDPAVLHKHLPRHFTPRTNRIVRSIVAESTTMDLDLDDHIQFRTFMDGAFDIMPVIMAKYFCREKLYVDVGANVGTTCLPVANCQIETVAIEASPTILGRLYRNLALNPKARMLVLGVAVGDQEREVINMYLPGGGNAGASSIYQDWNSSQRNPTVERQFIFKLDSLIEFYGLGRVGLLKLDIEGHEVPALLGAASLLARSQPAVLFEWRPDVAAKAGLTIKSPAALFPTGYSFLAVSVEHLERGPLEKQYTVRFAPFDQNQSYENVLCVSRNNPDHQAIIALASHGEPLRQTIAFPAR